MKETKQGLKENLGAFSLLVLVNAFVGGMVGIERSIIPQLAQQVFHLEVGAALLSFILFFGLSKAFANYFTGRYSNAIGRKKLLVWGWIFALPVPWILMHTTHWEMVIFANILLGIHQGLSWSSTVVMKIDLVGSEKRGLAMGLNEFAGYLSVAFFAYITGYLASSYGIRPYPFYVGIGLSVLGFLSSLIWVKDTLAWVNHEIKEQPQSAPSKHLFRDTTWKHPVLGSVTQAGWINNLNDGMVWGMLPIMMGLQGFNLAEIGAVAGVYPAVWGILQLFTGAAADHYSPKKLLVWGMLLQTLAILSFPFCTQWLHWILAAGLLGVGTAMVYPVFMVMIAAHTAPQDRAGALGIFRFWRDLGYAGGALISGWIAYALGIHTAVAVVGALTFIGAMILQIRVPQKNNL